MLAVFMSNTVLDKKGRSSREEGRGLAKDTGDSKVGWGPANHADGDGRKERKD